MLAVTVYREAYGESGSPFDLSEIGDIEIRMVRSLPFCTGFSLIFGFQVGGSDICCSGVLRRSGTGMCRPGVWLRHTEWR